MAQQKGGRKLRRTARHAHKYAAQFFRTERNKAHAKAKIARRKLENPNPKKTHAAENHDRVAG